MMFFTKIMLLVLLVVTIITSTTLAFSILSSSNQQIETSSSSSDVSTAILSTVSKAVKAIAGVGVLTVFALSASPTGLSAEYPLKFRIMAQLRTPLMVFIVVPLSFARWYVYRRLNNNNNKTR
jgi:acetylglutamate synthase